MSALTELRRLLNQAKKPCSEVKTTFFKTKPGEYAEHDQFIGVTVPDLRKISKQYSALSLLSLQELIKSPINEERLLALFILINRYQKNNHQIKQEIYEFYLYNLKHINNWNLVDASAHWIIGAHLLNNDKSILLTLAQSQNMWERRISIVSTLYFIRQNQFEFTLEIAEKLLCDSQDLIHKSVGWMLREMGKRNQQMLVNFLKKNAHQMPRTMLRYAIEKFSASERKVYLSIKNDHVTDTR